MASACPAQRARISVASVHNGRRIR
jgi:hypothetical protein